VVPQGCAMKKKATKMLILHFAEAGILAGRWNCGCEFITKISIIQSDLSFKLELLQFPHCPAFIASVNNSHQQSIKVVLVDCEIKCSSHGQLFIECSWVRSAEQLYTHAHAGGTKNTDVRCIMTLNVKWWWPFQGRSYSKRTSINSFTKVYDFVGREFRKIAKIYY
jgi:hypothetical protein